MQELVTLHTAIRMPMHVFFTAIATKQFPNDSKSFWWTRKDARVKNKPITNQEATLDALEVFRVPETASPIFLINSFEESLFCSIWCKASSHQAVYWFFLSLNALHTFKYKIKENVRGTWKACIETETKYNKK